MISDEYKDQLSKLHKIKIKTFGTSEEIPSEVERCLKEYNITSVLDFGCGKGLVSFALRQKYPNLQVYSYDPGREEFSTLPNNVDMIFSQDVLEHIELDKLDETLVDLANRCNLVMFHLIACHPAKKKLPDGRNAHLIIENPEWWKQKLKKLNWKMYNEFIIDKTSEVKKGPPIRVVKYGVTLDKNGIT